MAAGYFEVRPETFAQRPSGLWVSHELAGDLPMILVVGRVVTDEAKRDIERFGGKIEQGEGAVVTPATALVEAAADLLGGLVLRQQEDGNLHVVGFREQSGA